MPLPFFPRPPIWWLRVFLWNEAGGDPIARKWSFDEAKDVSISMMKPPLLTELILTS